MKQYAILITGVFGAAFFLGASTPEITPHSAEKISPGGIRYVAILVSDMDKMTAFFEDVLGFEGASEKSFSVYEVEDGQYLALVPRGNKEVSPGRIVVGFQVDRIDDYFRQVTSHGVEAIDPMKDDRVLTRPVYRQWGAREFGVKTPEGDILMFTRMPLE